MPPPTRYATTADGARIAYQTFGSGDLDLVVAGGYPWHMELGWEQPGFARLLERLGSFARVVVFDRRGVGLSDAPAPGDSLERRAADLDALLRAAGSERASFVTFGEGGLAAMHLAAAAPERVGSLVLISPYARLVRDNDDEPGITAAELDAMVERVERVWGTGDWAVSTLFPPYANDPLFRAWAGRVERYAGTPTEAVRVWRHIATLDVRLALPRIQAPTLVVTRRDNPGHGPGHGPYLAARIPGAKVLDLPGEVVGTFFDADPHETDEIQDFLTGTRADPEPERALAAIMFTDIVGSTSAAAAAGDRRWRDILDRHDVVVDAQVRRFGGRVVKGTGDGALAVFTSPSNALRCAWAARDELRGLGLETRAGIHVGEIELRGNDIAGLAVHIAQRVSSLAPDGEVVVSQTAADLLAGTAVCLVDHGRHELKGVAAPWAVFRAMPEEHTP